MWILWRWALSKAYHLSSTTFSTEHATVSLIIDQQTEVSSKLFQELLAYTIGIFLKKRLCNSTFKRLVIQNIKNYTYSNMMEEERSDFSLTEVLNLGSRERIQWPVNLDGNLFTNLYVKFCNSFNKDYRQQSTVVSEIPINLSSIEITGIFILY